MGLAYIMMVWQKGLRAGQTFAMPQDRDMPEGLRGLKSYNKESHPHMLASADLEVFVYAFSAPRIGNLALKRVYQSLLPNTYNHVLGADLVPLMSPWHYTFGHQIHAQVLDHTRLLGLRSFWDKLRPSKVLRALMAYHLEVPFGFMGYFAAQGAACEQGYDEMRSCIRYKDTKAPLPMHELSRACARSSPMAVGSEVRVRVLPNQLPPVSSFLKRCHEILTDLIILAVLCALVYVAAAAVFKLALVLLAASGQTTIADPASTNTTATGLDALVCAGRGVLIEPLVAVAKKPVFVLEWVSAVGLAWVAALVFVECIYWYARV